MIDDSKTDDSEMEFVRDQRTGRNLWIGGKTETCDPKDETTKEDANENCEGLMVTESETDEDDKTDDDEEVVRYEEKMKKKAEKDAIEERRREKREEKVRLLKVAETIERSNISYNMAAQVINDVRAVEGKITENEQVKVVYKQKMVRIVSSSRKLKMKDRQGRVPEGIMFDARKDKVKERVVGTKS